MRRVLASLILASSMALLAPNARAQSDADKATARALAIEGLTALDRKDYVTAAERLARAEGIFHAPTNLLGLARAQVGLGRWVSAQETYLKIVREGAAPGAPAAFVKAVEDAKVELAALQPRVPSVVIEVRGAPAAAVTVDGAPIPSASLGVRRPVDPGQHVIRATADGLAPAEATLAAAEGRSSSVTLELRAGAAGAAVVAAQPADAGGASGRKIGGIVALSVGGALVVTGAVMLALDLTSSSPATDPCNPTPTDTSGPPYGILSAVTFAAGGAGIVTGAVLLATLPKAPAAPAAVSFAPVVAPGYLGLRGTF